MIKLNVVSFLSGVLFSIGLGISGMTQPQKVISFLNVLGEWDPSLAFVMGAAIVSYFFINLWVQKNYRYSFLGGTFQNHTRINLDRSLILGAILFGTGWGLAGHCPGPAVTSMDSGSRNAFFFVLSMGIGKFIVEKIFSHDKFKKL